MVLKYKFQILIRVGVQPAIARLAIRPNTTYGDTRGRIIVIGVIDPGAAQTDSRELLRRRRIRPI